MKSRISIYNDLVVNNNIIDTYSNFVKSYFFHPGGDALRLSSLGLKYLSQYYTCHTIDVLEKGHSRTRMPSKHYVFLGKYCKTPYYIDMYNIVFFDEETAFLFKLCDGDIDNVKSVTDKI